MTPEVTVHTVRAMDHIGAVSKPFLQGMLNRLAIGALRYGRHPAVHDNDNLFETAKRRIDAAAEANNRDLLIDAANWCLLAWLGMPEAPPDGGSDSPGVVRKDGSVWGQRGKYAER